MAADPEPTWAQLLGLDSWNGLLDPLHPSLRALILRCGDLVQATYDAFNNDPNSPYCGASRYGKASFFRKVMLDRPDHYDVASFLYATARVSVPEAFLLRSLSREAWDRESNWIGYVAVTSDRRSQSLGRREIYVVWRGTTRNFEWINVFGAAPESATGLLSAKSIRELKRGNEDGSSSSDEDDERTPKVMKGWLTIYTSDDPNSPSRSKRENAGPDTCQIPAPTLQLGEPERSLGGSQSGRVPVHRERLRLSGKRGNGRSGRRHRVRVPAGGEQGLQRAVRQVPQPEGAAREERDRPDPALPGEAAGVRAHGRGAGDRHEEVAELEGVEEPERLAQPGGDAARGGGVERGAWGVRDEGEEERGAGEQVVRVSEGGVSRAGVVVGGEEQGDGEEGGGRGVGFGRA
ncbi:Phospholipase A1-IIdelta [Spatholobus suberectus]|nr:Phospholipase A1-IIdelta [Spatholobus suberectus]